MTKAAFSEEMVRPLGFFGQLIYVLACAQNMVQVSGLWREKHKMVIFGKYLRFCTNLVYIHAWVLIEGLVLL